MDDGEPDLIAALAPILQNAGETGGRLPPERALAETLAVPRRRLRAALGTLETQGRVFRRHGQGTFVTPPPHPGTGRHRLLAGRVSLNQLMAARLLIEPHLAGLAAAQATPARLGALREAMSATARAPDPEAYDHSDDAFHYRIAELAADPLMLDIYSLIRALRREAGWREQRQATHGPAPIARLAAQHAAILDAIAAADPDSAAAAMRTHLQTVAGMLDASGGGADEPFAPGPRRAAPDQSAAVSEAIRTGVPL